MTAVPNKTIFYLFIVCISALCFLSIFYLKPVISGDGPTYVQAMQVLEGAPVPAQFVPNRILSTFMALVVVIVFSKVFGSLTVGWMALNIIFYFAFSIAFYKLILEIFKSGRVAFLSSLFLAGNYAVIVFGLGYLMDIGGWAFYALSLYFSLRYAQTSQRKMLLYSALAVGIGGLFKEYAFLGIIPIAFLIIYESRPKVTTVIKKAIIPALLAIVPICIVYAAVFYRFSYTYATWFSANQQHYVYASRLVEYVKSLGSLYNFLAFAVLGGAYFLFRDWKRIVPEVRTRVFIISAAVSALPVLVWPAITQRILFITVPGAIIIASFLFRKYEKYWLAFIPLLAIYIICSFFMNSYILGHFNLPI